MAEVAVLGGGAWGTAVAQMLASDGRDVTLWALEPEVVAEINADHRNTRFLPDADLAPSIRATGDLGDVADAQVVLAVVPAQHLRKVLAQMPAFAGDLVICAKGIEQSTGALMSDAAHDACPQATLAALSGPTFAHEVAAGLPAAVTLACEGGEEQWERLSPVIARPTFRPYYSADLIGAEIGGAVKNVLAIACGVVDGLALGQNARNALIGEGQSAADLMANRQTVAEGAHTAPVLQRLARAEGIDMPIVDAVVALLEGAKAADIADALLARPLTTERRPA
mgnify:CR=1 FL=1